MFICDTCKCSFTRQYSYTAHCTTLKHLERLANTSKHVCECGKQYLHQPSLSKHRKKCDVVQNKNKKLEVLEEQVNLLKLQCKQECKTLYVEKELDNDSLCDVKLKLVQLSEKVEELNARCKTIDGKRISQKSTRKPTKQIRIDVYNKQNKQCNMCKVELNDVWQLDHCVALQFGGEDNIENLQALCCQCHATKSIQENKKRKEIKDAIQTILQY